MKKFSVRTELSFSVLVRLVVEAETEAGALQAPKQSLKDSFDNYAGAWRVSIGIKPPKGGPILGARRVGGASEVVVEDTGGDDSLAFAEEIKR